MSALYFSISKDQASSLPDRHSRTRRTSFQAIAGFFVTLTITRVMGADSPPPFACKAARHSRAHRVRALRDEGCQPHSLLPPECRDWPEKSSVGIAPESPARGHRVSSVAGSWLPLVTPPRSRRSPPPRAWPDALGRDSRGGSRPATAKH